MQQCFYPQKDLIALFIQQNNTPGLALCIYLMTFLQINTQVVKALMSVLTEAVTKLWRVNKTVSGTRTAVFQTQSKQLRQTRLRVLEEALMIAPTLRVIASSTSQRQKTESAFSPEYRKANSVVHPQQTGFGSNLLHAMVLSNLISQ